MQLLVVILAIGLQMRPFRAHRRPVTLGGAMKKTVFTAVVAAALLAAPLPVLMQSAVAQTTQPAPAKAAKAKKPPTAGQLAARERQKKCGAKWKAAKAAGKVEKSVTWPKYWSASNKRLKAAAGKS
jgi:hypothetical protein